MIKRLIIAIILLVVVVGGIVGFNIVRANAIKGLFASQQPEPVTVSTVDVAPITWKPGIEAIGTALLERFVPGSSALAPLAGTLIARGYGRTEEYAADRHGVEILRRAGYPADIMLDTLGWLRAMSGDGGGGFLSTHQAIDERMAALRKIR